MILRAALLLALAGSVASCGIFGGSERAARRADAQVPLPFKAKLSKDSEDDRLVAVSVQPKGQVSVDALRESVRFEATKYCLLAFGGSEAEWEIDPVTNDWAYTTDGDALVFNARCTSR